MNRSAIAPQLSSALRDAAHRLRAAGVDSPEADARILTSHALGVRAIDLIADPQRLLTRHELQRLEALLERRALREPVSRILGRREFYGRSFAISPATLDPRPDTETIVDLALEIADREGWRARPIRIIDVGTGSGCILLTLLAELPLATGLGTDIDRAALDVAVSNSHALSLSGRARFEERRSLEGLAGAFDLLVSNPPYIPSVDIAALEPEVRQFDPMKALDGGEDGLAVFRDIAAGLSSVVPRGWAIFEAGAGQSQELLEILDPRRSGVTRVRRDLGGIERCVAVKSQF